MKVTKLVHSFLSDLYNFLSTLYYSSKKIKRKLYEKKKIIYKE